MKNKKNKQAAMIKSVTEEIAEENQSKFDVLGSYTGNPTDGGEPQQDADDL